MYSYKWKTRNHPRGIKRTFHLTLFLSYISSQVKLMCSNQSRKKTKQILVSKFKRIVKFKNPHVEIEVTKKLNNEHIKCKFTPDA
jgi:hypothetical protein